MSRLLILSTDAELATFIRSALDNAIVVEKAGTVEAALGMHERQPFDIIFTDLALLNPEPSGKGFTEAARPFKRIHPGVQFVVLTARQALRNAARVVQSGANDYLTYPLDGQEVRLVVASAREATVKGLELDYLRNQFWKTDWLDFTKTRNASMHRVVESLRSVAPTIATVLLLGETGTGKSLLARLIHLHSLRSGMPFIAVQCGAMAETLLESELFGHEKGAFTGAVRDKPGKFEMAQGGTLFLDEIGTLSPTAQIKLLQVLQDGTFNRVGGNALLKCDVRLIAATNTDLKRLTDRGKFRKDLFYRLNVFPIETPPLRSRLEDIPQMVEVCLKNLNAQYGKNISGLHPVMMEAFHTYSWPGNIRELENLVERAYILECADTLSPQGFPSELIPPGTATKVDGQGQDLTLASARRIAIAEFERCYVKELMARNRGKINLSAKAAGITPRQLNRLMARHHIHRNDYKGRDREN
ncbi:MAG: sigma-54 dependent transcriptional regulator [Deltaproteobacteria bacterium]|nr:sigma-54 dependent transcriptional regulator [Deltaproteobacteria bacterium]